MKPSAPDSIYHRQMIRIAGDLLAALSKAIQTLDVGLDLDKPDDIEFLNRLSAFHRSIQDAAIAFGFTYKKDTP